MEDWSEVCRRLSAVPTDPEEEGSTSKVAVQLQILSDDEMEHRFQALEQTSASASISKSKSRSSSCVKKHDIHNTALMEPSAAGMSALRQLSILNGSLATLMKQRTKTTNTVIVTILLCLDKPHHENTSTEEMPVDDIYGAEDIPPIIRVSSTLAASLGCAWSTTTTSTKIYQEIIATNDDEGLFLKEYVYDGPEILNQTRVAFSSEEDSIPIADVVALHCLGCPVSLATSETLVCPRPPKGILLSPLSSLLRVHDPISNLYFYYHVVDVTARISPEEKKKDTPQNSALAKHRTYRTTIDTTYSFLDAASSSLGYTRRLPALSVFPDDIERTNDSDQWQAQQSYPHPDLLPLAKSLRGITASKTTSPRERVFSIVGTDYEHDVRRLVQAASHSIGMRCLSVAGLAAFAAIHGHPVTTGSLSDQLEGLQMALDQAKKCAPCVLHLVDFDLEFSSSQHQQDPSQSEEQEYRVWSLLMDALDSTHYMQQQQQQQQVESTSSMPTDKSASGVQENPIPIPTQPQQQKQRLYYSSRDMDPTDRRWAPTLIIVISTTQPMAKVSATGPFVQNMTYDAMSLTLPNANFAKYLWEECDGCVVDRDKCHEKLLSVEDIQEQIAERTVHDIRILHEQWNTISLGSSKTGVSGEAEAATTEQERREQFAKLCQELDRKRQTQTSKSSSVAKIANVKWDDVGGLSQVRREIMDTIELPLQYPQFFPHGGRSGILLYGPPGSGKTLVAKAVATECHIPFLSVKGPELLGSYVGESEANVRGVFASAREAALASGGRHKNTSSDQTSTTSGNTMASPKACLVFFDELDSLAPRRDDTASGSGGGVMDRVVSTLAAELDKGQQKPHQQNSGNGSHNDGNCYIFVLGATNRPDLLDPSLLRPGRFDRMVYLGVASTPEDRARILAAQIRHLKFERGLTAQEVAESIVDRLPDILTGADLSSIGSGALARATQRLCSEADHEVNERLENSKLHNKKEATAFNDDEEELAVLDEILSAWDEDRLVPVITIDDMLEASKDIIPSVSATDLERYEKLRLQFSSA